MKYKLVLINLLLIGSITLHAQNKAVGLRNEVKIGVEIPVVGKSGFYPIQNSISQGFSVRYLRNIYGNFFLGVSGGGHYYVQICEMDEPAEFFYNTFSYSNYYSHAVLYFKVIDNECFMFALNGSAGVEFKDYRGRILVVSPNPTEEPFSINSETIVHGRSFHYLLGAETAYRITPNFSINLDYKYDHKNSKHLIGVGLGYAF